MDEEDVCGDCGDLLDDCSCCKICLHAIEECTTECDCTEPCNNCDGVLLKDADGSKFCQGCHSTGE